MHQSSKRLFGFMLVLAIIIAFVFGLSDSLAYAGAADLAPGASGAVPVWCDMP